MAVPGSAIPDREAFARACPPKERLRAAHARRGPSATYARRTRRWPERRASWRVFGNCYGAKIAHSAKNTPFKWLVFRNGAAAGKIGGIARGVALHRDAITNVSGLLAHPIARVTVPGGFRAEKPILFALNRKQLLIIMRDWHQGLPVASTERITGLATSGQDSALLPSQTKRNRLVFPLAPRAVQYAISYSRLPARKEPHVETLVTATSKGINRRNGWLCEFVIVLSCDRDPDYGSSGLRCRQVCGGAVGVFRQPPIY